jgi:hypothetical protein
MDFGVGTQRMHRRAFAMMLALFAGLIFTACSTPAPKPTPTSTAVFATEEEALAAATDTYQRYTAALDSESAKGDVSAESIRTLVTPEFFEEFLEPSTIATNGWHTEGATTFDSVSLIAYTEDADHAQVSLKLCRDVSGLQIMDSAGAEVHPPGRSERFPVEVRFVSDANDSTELLISASGSWPGDDFC